MQRAIATVRRSWNSPRPPSYNMVRTPFHASVHVNLRMPELPIKDVLPDLKAALREQPEAVLQAPTGASKMTRVPLPLLDADRLDFGKDQP